MHRGCLCTQRNPRSPDFKFKETGEPLWIESYNTPPWVQEDLAAYDARRQHQTQESWVRLVKVVESADMIVKGICSYFTLVYLFVFPVVMNNCSMKHMLRQLLQDYSD